MLPFMRKKMEGSVSENPETSFRKPDDDKEDVDSLHTAAEDILQAINSKNIKALSDSLKAFYDLRDALPHLQGDK